MMTPKQKILFDDFERILSYVLKGENAGEAARELLEVYGTLDAVLTVDRDSLASFKHVGGAGADYIKLIGAVTSRRGTEKFKLGIRHTEREINEYFVNLYRGMSVEAAALMCFDSDGRAIRCDLFGDGTVNASEILPRKLLEVACSVSAASVIIAHNHPRGKAEASAADIETTARLTRVCFNSKIKLLRHIIVAGNNVYSIDDTNRFIDGV